MDILCMTGEAPGHMDATLSHLGCVRQLRFEVARHPVGGWRARRPGGAWGVRCHSVRTAILLEAAEAVMDEGTEVDHDLAAD
jgi:hypothetical protein